MKRTAKDVVTEWRASAVNNDDGELVSRINYWAVTDFCPSFAPGLGSGALREALERLCDKLDKVAEDTKGIFALAHCHGSRYAGANWKEEYDAARALLSLSSLPESAAHVNCICGQPAVRYAPPRCEQWPKCCLDFSGPTKQDTERGQEIAGELGAADPRKAGSEVRGGGRGAEMNSEKLAGYTHEGYAVPEVNGHTLSFTLFCFGLDSQRPVTSISLAFEFNKTPSGKKRPYGVLCLGKWIIQSGWLF